MFSDNNRHKKARRACAVRAFRTSSDDSGNHRWRILVGWRPCVLFYTYMIFMVIFLSLFIKGSIKGPKKGVITDFTFSRAKILDTANV